jgi:hypothetical protein
LGEQGAKRGRPQPNFRHDTITKRNRAICHIQYFVLRLWLGRAAPFVVTTLLTRKAGGKKQKARKHPLSQGKAEHELAKRLAKRLANLWRRVTVKKKARAVRGQEIKWEIPD